MMKRYELTQTEHVYCYPSRRLGENSQALLRECAGAAVTERIRWKSDCRVYHNHRRQLQLLAPVATEAFRLRLQKETAQPPSSRALHQDASAITKNYWESTYAVPGPICDVYTLQNGWDSVDHL
jgi:hypothetical protein